MSPIVRPGQEGHRLMTRESKHYVRPCHKTIVDVYDRLTSQREVPPRCLDGKVREYRKRRRFREKTILYWKKICIADIVDAALEIERLVKD